MQILSKNRILKERKYLPEKLTKIQLLIYLRNKIDNKIKINIHKNNDSNLVVSYKKHCLIIRLFKYENNYLMNIYMTKEKLKEELIKKIEELKNRVR